MILFAIDPGVNGACSIYVDRKLCKIFDVPTMTDGKKRVTTKEIIKIFTKPGINDELMMSYRNKYFNKK